MSADQRNIVFIMTDQQAYNMVACNGYDYVKTPRLDALAASGCRFTSMYTASPICTPARAALFSGMWPSSSGAAFNQAPLYPNVRNMGQVFRDAGFTTGYIGKWHLDGWHGSYYGTGECPDGFPDEYWYDGRRFIEDVGEEGFAKWKQGKDLKPEDCWGTRVADRAVDFIARHNEDPFCLVVSLDEPHGPSSAPEEYYAMYKGTQRPHDPSMDDTLEGKPETQHYLRASQKNGGYVPPGELPNNSPKYYGCNTFTDSQIGRVVDAVDKYCPDNTVIVYTVDHGDHAGAHGLLSKGPTLYEEITRVSFFMRVPGMTQPGSVSDALLSHIDLAPTLCRLAGIAPDPQFQGQDFLPVLSNPEDPGREAVFFEFTRWGLPHSTRGGLTPIRGIRTRQYKLGIYLLDQTDELYDLEDDPDELKNRIADPALADVRNNLHDRLCAWMDVRIDPFRGNAWWQRAWRPDKKMPPDYDSGYAPVRRFKT